MQKATFPTNCPRIPFSFLSVLLLLMVAGGYAPILFSTKIREYLKSKGHGLQITDVTALTENVPPNLPQLRIDDGEGNLIHQTALPKTEDAVLETIKAHGG